MLRRTNIKPMSRQARAVLILAISLTACPDRRLQDARTLAEAGKSREAAEAFVALAKSDPANLAAWDGAIQIWCQDEIHVGQCMSVLDLELKLLGTLQRHRDALAEVLERRARARLAQGMMNAAIDDLERSVKAGPERATVHAARARVFMMQGDRARMLEALKRARTLDPNLAEVETLYGLVPTEPGQADAEPPSEAGFGGEPTVRVSPTAQ